MSVHADTAAWAANKVAVDVSTDNFTGRVQIRRRQKEEKASNALLARRRPPRHPMGTTLSTA